MGRVRDAGPSPEVDLVTASLALVLPDEPPPVRLMNTIWADRSGVHDALTTTANLRAWLAATGAGTDLTPDSRDVNEFRAVRDGLRRLAALLTGDTRPDAASATTDVRQAVADVNRAVTKAPTLPQLAYEHGDLRLATQRSARVARALSSIAGAAVDLLTDDDRTLLRACNAPGCVLYFSKGHPRREWCSTACGNRARAARHYQRHHKAEP